MTLTIYGFGRSRAQRAVWACEEAGVEYTYAPLDARAGDLRKPEYLALNPGGKVPTLVHDGFVVTESPVICTYIADLAPERGLVPPYGTRARITYEQWMAFTVTELEQPLWTMGKHKFALPPDWRVPEVLAVVPKEFARAEKVLSRGLGDRPFMLGDAFTMVDVLVGQTLFWAAAFGLQLTAENVQRYAARLSEREGWQRTLKLTMG